MDVADSFESPDRKKYFGFLDLTKASASITNWGNNIET